MNSKGVDQFVSGSGITSDDITTNLDGIVSIPVAELISKALMIFIISAVVASLKRNDEEAFSLSLILFIPGWVEYFSLICSRICSLDCESTGHIKISPYFLIAQ